MLDLKTGRPLGDFGSQALLAPYSARPAELHPRATLFGLPNSATIPWGVLVDANGVEYCFCRELPGYVSPGCWLMSDAGHQGMLMSPLMAGLWVGGIAVSEADGAITWQSTDSYSGTTPHFSASFDGTRMTWREGDVLDLVAEGGCPGYQIYEPTHAQGITNFVLKAKGKIAGVDAEGWIGFNCHFQKPGVTYRISELVIGGQLLVWMDVANTFVDGSWESGPIIVGRDGLGLAFITDSSGRVSFSRDVACRFELDEDDYPQKLTFTYRDAMTGEEVVRVWQQKPGRRMTDQPKMAPHLRHKRSAEGICLRLGENRPLSHGSAWPEFQADDRLRHFAEESEA